MSMPRGWSIGAAAVLIVIVAACLLRRAPAGDAVASFPPPPPGAKPDLELTEGGETYRLYGPRAYRVKGDALIPFKQIYDPDFFEKNYAVEGGRISRRGDDGRLYQVGRRFASGFEGVEGVRELVGPTHGWTSLTLQSPKAPTVADYVQLRKRLLNGQGDFLDNRLEVDRTVVHGGKAALRAYCLPPSRGMICAKASIDTELIHFVRGDDFWFSGWYRIEEGRPFTLMDLESTWIEEHPGMRICLDDDRRLYFELKWPPKPKYRQTGPEAASFPLKQWVHVEAHFKLSEKADGIAQLWQDGRKIIDARGQTLPLPVAIYNSLEIGISAHVADRPAVVFVDDVAVSDQRGGSGGLDAEKTPGRAPAR